MAEFKSVRGLIKDFIVMTYGSPAEAKDNGIRIRQTADAKELDPNGYEIGTTYFYRMQQGTTRLYRDLRGFALTYGVELYFYRYLADEKGWRQPKTGAELDGRLHFEYKQWPKDSWATMLVRFEVK